MRRAPRRRVGRGPARRRAGRPPARGRHRSGVRPARSAGPIVRAIALDGRHARPAAPPPPGGAAAPPSRRPPRSAPSRSGRPIAELDDGRHHRDRDHEIRPRPELEERGPRRPPRASGTRIAVTSSSGAADGPPVADDELADRDLAPARRRRPARRGRPAPSGSAGRRPPARRCTRCRRSSRGSGSGPRRSARAAAFSPSNRGGRSRRTQVRPGGERRDPAQRPSSIVIARRSGSPADVEDVVVDRAADPRRDRCPCRRPAASAARRRARRAPRPGVAGRR